MATPICVVYLNLEILNNKHNATFELQVALQNKMPDYYVYVIPHNDRTGEKEDLYLQVFHEKDFTEIQYQELKALIENHLQHQNQTT